jgi:hypothetical protein
LKSIPNPRRFARRLAALGALAAAAIAVTAAPASAAPIPAGGAAIDHASLDWSGDLAMQGPNFGLPHFFSAGVSKGTEATYKGAEGNAEVLLEKEGGAVATWATHTNYAAGAGEHQVVRLTNGTGRVEADGSTTISWDATFSVNYYGELTPWTIEDPTLTVDAAGKGALTATAIGCKASKGGAGCVPFAPFTGVQIATFEGVEINSLGEVTIDPDWAEVEVETGSATPQNRTVAGWGAWPQSFVNFQIETGLSSFFYSSGSKDAEKVPLPFVVDFTAPTPVSNASLDWIGNELMQSELHGFRNYFSAGLSDGKEGTYKGVDGNAEVYLEGSKKLATWDTREAYGPAAGQHQVVHLSKGSGVYQQYGPAEIEWDGAFSVNFYGGLVPFTIEDPTLLVDEDGTGELVATLLGCEAARANPNECTPFAPATTVQVATFSGVEINGADELVIDPDYSEVTITEPAGAAPQIRTGAGWGAWPQSLVNFQGLTGLSSYWYSSGDADSAKPGLPFVVDLAGREPEIVPDEKEVTPVEPEKPSDDGGSKSDDNGSKADEKPAPAPAVGKPATLKLGKKTVSLSQGRVVQVATVICPAGGATCRTVVPSRVKAKIAGKRYVLTVFAPKQIAAGKSAPIKVGLPKAAKAALEGKKLAVRIRVGLVANGVTAKHVVKVKIAGKR